MTAHTELSKANFDLPVYSAMAVNHLKAWFSLQVISAFNQHMFNLPVQRWVKDHEISMNDMVFKSEVVLDSNRNGVALKYSLSSKGLNFNNLGSMGLNMTSLVGAFMDSLLVEQHVDRELIIGMNVKVEDNLILVTVPLAKPLKAMVH